MISEKDHGRATGGCYTREQVIAMGKDPDRPWHEQLDPPKEDQRTPLLSVREMTEASWASRNKGGNFHDGFGHGAIWAEKAIRAKITSGELIPANEIFKDEEVGIYEGKPVRWFRISRKTFAEPITQQRYNQMVRGGAKIIE